MVAPDRTYYSREAEMRANEERWVGSLLFLMAGVAIGAAIALLLAERARQRRRPNLLEAIEERFNRIEKELNNVGKRVMQPIKELR
jgi:uncharacterized membrane-anchored protein YhcB (DUF1043 family)